ncbi:DEAD/DEAH box helicase [Reyranella sp.]|jgi:DNA repair protein RadD|uniref:DEAD/DEAH box helicase n=1 Tax=Reyranella sp. TaxID=1929291 RepID=UPI000BC564AE|nr:DEAD/DEAH box helicase [Reyranella sp.]OYY46686.1 MAG: DNA helicase [Rhodospirillales bacterium 35-66-84]OYZ96706.1 MAG: DNA helicase [Rhodospirillales bacterium 24-66-33]OZB27967.1 MAG: DNA helicase [Rhodospirillales bacterium 39-66-50]HQS18438.1 DEAD/DEAH box helicase [Reyranella sp.]HQT10069.1 DEAD/DEAH box helicase [Reyranella sp.]
MLSLRPYQQAAVSAIYQYFAEKDGHPLVVIPTAGGKSIVLASFIQGVLQQWPDQRILVVTHVRELIAQNHAEMMGLWPEAPAGIYSAGLGRRDIGARVLFAGIQSIHRRAYDVQQCDLLLIDEAHLIPRASDTMYRRFLDTLVRINPKLKVIGFTATPYRLDSGLLHEGEGRMFTDIAYEVSIRDLIDHGYLCPLISKATDLTLDVGGVGSRGGEFIPGQLQAAVDREAITRAATDEILAYGEGRRSWLAFCSGVEHATHVAEALRERGVACATIFGDTPGNERDRIIAAFKRGEIRALASMGVLTTGFNAPAVDLIAMLRPTKSAGLYVQMAGRGTRLAPGKDNCLVLDFAGNVARHGPIDAVKAKKPAEGEGPSPTKICPDCDSILAAAVRQCPDCGHQFPPPEVKVAATASTLAILSAVRAEWMEVSEVSCRLHEKPGKPPSMRVDYSCGLVRHSEWICFEHAGYARQKAVDWWRRRSSAPVPSTVAEALRSTDSLVVPTAIFVRPSGRFTEVVNHRFEPWPQASAPSATASPAASVGSMPAIASAIPGATPVAGSFARSPARTSATRGAA